MKENLLLILGLVFALIGVILLYDARDISKKLFGFGDQNEAALGLKILGFFVAMIGTLIIYFK